MITATTIGLGAAKMLASAGLSTIMQDRNNRQAQEMAAKDRAENYKYGEMAADNAQQRQIEMTESYMTPEAQVAHLRAAGLSPSLMYGAGGGTQGTSAPIGTGANGVQTQYNSLKMQDMLTMAQIGNIEAQTEKLKAETDTERGDNDRGAAQIKLLLEQKGAVEANKAYMESQTIFQKIQNYIAESTKNIDIDYVKWKADKMHQEADKAYWEAEREGLAYQMDTQTFEELVKQAKLTTKNLAKDLLVKNSQIKLNNQQTEALIDEISIKWKEYFIDNDTYKLKTKYLNFEQDKFAKELNLKIQQFNKEQNLKMDIAQMEAMTRCLTGIFGGVAGGLLMKGFK